MRKNDISLQTILYSIQVQLNGSVTDHDWQVLVLQDFVGHSIQYGRLIDPEWVRAVALQVSQRIIFAILLILQPTNDGIMRLLCIFIL